MGIIPFSAAPYNTPIRWRGKWWTRNHYWFLLGSDNISQAMDQNTLVAVFRKDMKPGQIQNILEEIAV